MNTAIWIAIGLLVVAALFQAMEILANRKIKRDKAAYDAYREKQAFEQKMYESELFERGSRR